MKWIKQGNKQVAQGSEGKFVIEYKRGTYRATYYGNDITFNFPWQHSIKKLKEMCQDNFYWEE